MAAPLEDNVPDFTPHFHNHLIAVSGSTILALVIGSMAGYELSRFEFQWKFPPRP